MKFSLASDLHLEFNSDVNLTAPADVLILSGDICVADHFTRSVDSPYQKYKQLYQDFFSRCADNFEHVLYVMGNHEHYHGQFEKTADILRTNLDGLATLLDNESVELNGVKFIGTTLWTDMNKQNPLSIARAQSYMNDYRVIKTCKRGVYRKLNPSDTIAEHIAALQFIDEETRDHDNCVVIGHHGPTPLSITPEFKEDFHGNGAYVSDLSDFILARPQIKLWTHGHVHSFHDYTVGSTRVLCNPGGYPHEGIPFVSNLIVEV